ncbi:Protein pelota-like protein, partial [Bienertia sinuspersici]
MGGAILRWVMQLHKDVPKAANFYSQGLGFTVNVCTPRWAELHLDSFKLALLHSPRTPPVTVTDINCTVMKLMELGAELDGPIKHEIHGKVVFALLKLYLALSSKL